MAKAISEEHPIFLYNTLTRRKERLVPRDGRRVTIYECGLTPSGPMHVGHARTALFYSVLCRYLEYRGYAVLHVKNFTDIDDKIIAAARQEGVAAAEVAARNMAEYHAMSSRLGLRPADVYPLVTRHIPEIITLVSGLVEKGVAYPSGGDVYFDTLRFPEYGRLSGQDPEQLQAGARVEVGEGKRNPADFALWKAAKPGEPAWDSPWGPGRPGWHIECSAMALKYLGHGFDIHGSGADLVFPHNENELAQAEAYTGCGPYARCWTHGALLNVSGEKMSKSLGNFWTVRDVLGRYPPQALAFLFVNTHYRMPMDYEPELLDFARRSQERLADAERDWGHRARAVGAGAAGAAAALPVGHRVVEAVERARGAFERAMDDDVNTSQAMAALFELINEVNAYLHDRGPAVDAADGAALALAQDALGQLGGLLHVWCPEGAGAAGGEDAAAPLAAAVDLLIEIRQEARARRDYAAADRIRDRLAEVGITLEDTPYGTRWKRQ